MSRWVLFMEFYLKNKARISIGLWGIEDQHLSSTIQKHQLFWIGNHFEADVRQNFADTLSKAIEQGYTKEMLENISIWSLKL